MWEAAAKVLTSAQSPIVLIAVGSVFLLIGVSRKWKIEPESRKFLNRAGLGVLASGLALLMFREVMGYVS